MHSSQTQSVSWSARAHCAAGIAIVASVDHDLWTDLTGREFRYHFILIYSTMVEYMRIICLANSLPVNLAIAVLPTTHNVGSTAPQPHHLVVVVQ